MFFDKKVKGQNHHQFSLFIKNIIVNDQQECFASVDYNNTIYKFSNLDFTPYLKVEYANGKSLDYKLIADMTSKERVDYFFKGDFFKTASYPNMSVNNSDILVINYMFREKKGDLLTDSYRHYIRLKKEQKVIHAKCILNDITDFPDEVQVSSDSKGIISHEAWYRNYLIDVVSPYTELSKNETAVIDGIGEIDKFDNPIILMMELKNM